MSYTTAALLGVLGAVLLDLPCCCAPISCVSKGFWAAYAIIVSFELFVNGCSPACGSCATTRLDHRVADRLRADRGPDVRLLAMVLMSLSLWTWVRERSPFAAAARRHRPRSQASPGLATAPADDASGTATLPD